MLDFGIDIVPELSAIILIEVLNRLLISEFGVSVEVVAVVLLDRVKLDFLCLLLIFLLSHKEVHCIRPQLVDLVVKIKLLILQSPILEDKTAVQSEVKRLSLNQLLFFRVFIVDSTH